MLGYISSHRDLLYCCLCVVYMLYSCVSECIVIYIEGLLWTITTTQRRKSTFSYSHTGIAQISVKLKVKKMY